MRNESENLSDQVYSMTDATKQAKLDNAYREQLEQEKKEQQERDARERKRQEEEESKG